MSQGKLSPVELPDGTTAYVMTQEQAQALAELAENHIWLKQTEKRVKRVGFVAGGAIVLLTWLASLWPHLTRWIKLLFPDVQG